MNEKGEIRTRNIAWAALGLFIAVAGPGVWYWISTQAHFARCVYGDPTCSLTVSTYLLCVLTLGAFLAAYRAARYAQQAIEIEREVVVAIENCSTLRASLTPGGDDGTTSHHNPHRTEERYMKTVNNGFLRDRPDNYSRDQYGMVEFDCMSVGRSPVVNGSIQVKCKAPNGNENDRTISIGSIPTDEFIHLRLWLDNRLRDVEFTWIERSVRHKDGVVIEFHARHKDFALPVPFSALPEPAPAPAPPPAGRLIVE